MRAGISRVNRGGPLKLAHGVLQQALFLVEKSEIVVGLRIQVIPLKNRAVALEGSLEIARAVGLDRELEIVVRCEG